MRYEKEAHFTIIPAGEDHLVPTFSPRPSTNGGPMSTKESAPWHKLMAGTGASLARTMTYTWAHSRSLFMGEIAVLRKYTSWERSTAGSTLKISRITHRGTKTAGLIFHIGIAAQPRRSGGGASVTRFHNNATTFPRLSSPLLLRAVTSASFVPANCRPCPIGCRVITSPP
jgi:hypothetical protein